MSKRILRISVASVAVLGVLATIAAVALCVVFPNKYSRLTESAAEEFGLDPALVKSVVWAESRFDAKATSHKGARGLMQLMPETFVLCASRLGIDNAENKMYDPETSVRCGCYYLSYLKEKFDGSETAALMAYNAGEANARKFLSGERVFAETEKYLKNISTARKVYSLF